MTLQNTRVPEPLDSAEVKRVDRVLCLRYSGTSGGLYGGFPKLGVPFWGVPIVRTIVFWGLYWGPPILGNCHVHHFRGLGFRVCRV